MDRTTKPVYMLSIRDALQIHGHIQTESEGMGHIKINFRWVKHLNVKYGQNNTRAKFKRVYLGLGGLGDL